MKDQLNLKSLPRIEVFGGGKWQNGSSSNVTQNRESVCMDWVDRPNSCKGLYGILQLLQGSHLEKFWLKTPKLGWVAEFCCKSVNVSLEELKNIKIILFL